MVIYAFIIAFIIFLEIKFDFLLKKDKENLERIKVQVGMGLTY